MYPEPMTQAQIEEIVTGILEDWSEVTTECIPESKFEYVAQSIAESWIKDRKRALNHAR